jgi:sialate O-acetylesterase
LELHDVLVGDVRICAGQSNMQFGLRQARNGAEEIKNANYPDIRYFVVGERAAYSPVSVPRGSWRVVSPTTLGGGPRRNFRRSLRRSKRRNNEGSRMSVPC